ncbi:MAG: NAD(P)/FAD-dependent oxidoreductase [Planctomycetota bacterium]
MSRYETVVIGAGLAGLTCARHLRRAGRRVLVLEASDGVGGRVRTDRVEHDGGTFLLDRGFQVFLDAYPEAAEQLDLSALALRGFDPGAVIALGGKLHVVADPLRRPIDAAKSVRAPIASMRDVVRLIALHRRLLASADPADPSGEPNVRDEPTIDFLRRAGLSERLIDTVLRPFFGGVFFDRELTTSARMMAFCYRMFATGRATLPARGMGALSAQIADDLPTGTVRLGQRVVAIDQHTGRVETLAGDEFQAERIVLATDAGATDRLLAREPVRTWRQTTTLSFAADAPPIDRPMLVLDGAGCGPVNHLAVPSNVQPSYAPRGAALICANVVVDTPQTDGELAAAARAQLVQWFGDEVTRWRLLRVHRIVRALPDQSPPTLEQWSRTSELDTGVIVCGDHTENASINGALVAGRLAAERIIAGVPASSSTSSPLNLL